MLAPGLRVVRGPHWNWENQDGGEGYVGTVCEIGRPGSTSPDKTVVVQWDAGIRTNYRIGYQQKYDLRVVDSAQIGIKHQNIVCDGCKKQGIAGMRYRCLRCNDYDLCSLCYHSDKHDINHPFQRFDTTDSPGFELPIRRGAIKLHMYGIFVGAKVVRGHDWEWSNQDGGEGKTGRVMDIRGWDSESSRSVANVTWTNGTTNVYRLGHKGNVDLRFVQKASGGYYYRDHVPVLGEQPDSFLSSQTKISASRFSVGDKVIVKVSETILKQLQQGHGGWNQRMAEFIGKVGTVHRVTVRNDIRVQHEGCENRWTYNPLALVKITSFATGDIICVINDSKKVREFQKGHGEWIPAMNNILGKMGKVLKVYPDGDLRIQVDGMVWTLNPACIHLIPGSATELSNTMQADQNQRIEPSISWQSPSKEQTDQAGNHLDLADRLIKDAAHGKLDSVREIIAELREKCKTTSLNIVDIRSNGRTALQVASHEGQIHVVKFLLENGANVNLPDEDGDTALHYAAFGNQPAVIKLLAENGASINAINKGKCSALHIAAHKQPTNCISVLLEHGANINLQDLYGDTALHDAIGKENNSVIELLCDTPGMDFTLCNKRGFNVLHHASLKGNSFATRILLTKTRQLVDVKKDDGFSALHLAALNGHRDVVETLIHIGQADIDQRNNRNQTALLLSVSQGHCDVIELLVNLKSNINAQDEDGDTALHVVLLKRSNINSNIFENTSPNIYRIYNELDAHIIENKVPISIACYLVKMGCDFNISNNKGQLAEHYLNDPVKSELIKSYKNRHILIENTLHNELENNTMVSRNHTYQHRDNLNLIVDEQHSSPRNNSRNEIDTNNDETIIRPIDDSQRANLNTSSPRKVRTQSPGGSTGLTAKPLQTMLKAIQLNSNDKTGKTASSGNNNTNNGTSNSKPVECSICSELSEDNVLIEPCGHKPACEDCVARLKKCFMCGEPVQKRVTKDGRLIPPQSKQPSAERMRYLECKMAEIEETTVCSICMERLRNVVFLCGHGTCNKCADTLKTCHMCRKTITKKIAIY